MKQVAKVVQCGAKNTRDISFILLGMLLVMEIVLVGILFWGDSDATIVPLGGIMVLGAGGMLVFLATALSIPLEMNRAVRFGIPRKQALIGSIVSSLGSVVAWLLISLLSLGMDILVYRLLVPYATLDELQELLQEIGWNGLLSGMGIVMAIVAAAILFSLVMGAIVSRFGKVGFWTLYIVVFGGIFLVTAGANETNLSYSVQMVLGLLPTTAWIILAAMLALAGAVWSVWQLLHMEVQDLFG